MSRTKAYSLLLAMVIITIPDLIWIIPNVIFFVIFRNIGLLCNNDMMIKYSENSLTAISQFLAAKGFGQDPDTEVSMMLGRMKRLHESGKTSFGKGWLFFGKTVNFFFTDSDDHIVDAIEDDEDSKDAIISIHDFGLKKAE